MNIVIEIKDGRVERVLHDGVETVDVIVEDYDTLEGDQEDMDGDLVYKYDAFSVRDYQLVKEVVKHYSRSITERMED